VAVSATTTNAAIISSGRLNITAASWGSPVAHAPGFGGNGGTGASFVVYGSGGNGGTGGTGGNGGVGGSGGNGGVGGSFGWAHDPVNNHSLIGIVGQAGSTLQFSEAATGLAYGFEYGTPVGGGGGNSGFVFGSAPVHFAAFDSSNAHVSGMGHNWSAGETGFIGFRFLNASSNYLYGWIEIRIPTNADAGRVLTLVQWAYQDDPNGAIFAGMTDIPAPGALALVAFAAGAARTSGRRRRSG
jgi:hypothetical protein